MNDNDRVSANFPQRDPAKAKVFTDGVPAVPPKTFELGLVLGGTVSAGAYTAGALELLVQALDDFYGRFKGNPPHAIKLRLAAGSSGGAVCAAILGLSLNRNFTHVGDGAPPDQNALNVDGAGPADNKFWDLWVNQFQLLPMLEANDLAAVVPDPPDPDTGKPATPQHVPALLNGKVIDAASGRLIDYANLDGEVSRPWAASPFRVATTVCNLRGIPYKVEGIPSIGPYTGAAYVEHDDFAWFALPNVVGKDTGDDDGQRRPDEFWLSSSPIPGKSVSYQTLGDYARASGAMPVGLPARPLSRPAEQYLYRPYARVDDQGQPQIAWPSPDWSELGDVAHGMDYSFTGVDGGTLNNDPVKVAHEALAGIGKTNPREPDQANRALLLIDPLADQPGMVNPVGRSLVGVVEALIGTFVGGARYLTSDLDLFQDEDVFSRFQLVPTRTGLDGTPLGPTDANGLAYVGEAALAGTDLAALAGWATRPFGVHDYLLGRLNMAAYLLREMLLRADNRVFDGWSFDQRADWCRGANGDRLAFPLTPTTPPKSYYLPIIPFVPQALGMTEPAWPKGALNPENLRAPIRARATAVLGTLRTDNLPGFGPWLLSLLALGSAADTIADDLVKGLTTALSKRGLL